MLTVTSQAFFKDLLAQGYLNWGCANRLDIRLFSFPYLMYLLYKKFSYFSSRNIAQNYRITEVKICMELLLTKILNLWYNGIFAGGRTQARDRRPIKKGETLMRVSPL